ncbi:MAG: hypothetical protein P1U53_07365 [Sulfitobacter sp.]|nr:hypothetical protein [Sulfitobacter sp.]
MRPLSVLMSVLMIAGCGDPLASLDRVSDLELAETDPVAQAVPTDEEVAREGFFGTEASGADVTSPNENPAASASAETPQPPARGGLLGMLRRVAAGGDSDAAAPQEAPTTEVAEDAVETQPADTDATFEQAALPAEKKPRRAGLMGGLFAPRGGGSGPSAPASDISGLAEVDYDTVIPYGEIARSCAARGRPLGRKIETAQARGYRLYDSDPRAEGLRTFYVTGFPDGCPRQLTAANVLLGAPSLYEQLHYGPASVDLARGDTDIAYEKVKRRVCGTGRGKPCGSKIDRMDRSTFFITSYPRMDATPRWSEILIHEGEVVASGFKSAG